MGPQAGRYIDSRGSPEHVLGIRVSGSRAAAREALTGKREKACGWRRTGIIATPRPLRSRSCRKRLVSRWGEQPKRPGPSNPDEDAAAVEQPGQAEPQQQEGQREQQRGVLRARFSVGGLPRQGGPRPISPPRTCPPTV